MKFLIALIFLSPVAASAECPSRVDLYMGIQAQSFYYSSMKACAVQVSPSAKSVRWRSYSFFSTGLFMIFNSLGDGPESTHTSSRSYFLFPRVREPGYSLSRTGLTLTLSTGDRLLFDYKTGRTKSPGLDTLLVKEDPAVNAKNDGGVEIQRHSGLVVDTGYFTGEVGHSDPDRFSLVRDRKNRTCQLRNDLLFAYIYANDPYGKKKLQNVSFKFETDRELALFLQRLCPALDVSPLLKNLTRSVAQKSRKINSKKIQRI
ncbi:MAG: hypothetical protein ABL958_19045 [Bdellovibrionia bacterium]